MNRLPVIASRVVRSKALGEDVGLDYATGSLTLTGMPDFSVMDAANVDFDFSGLSGLSVDNLSGFLSLGGNDPFSISLDSGYFNLDPSLLPAENTNLSLDTSLFPDVSALASYIQPGNTWTDFFKTLVQTGVATVAQVALMKSGVTGTGQNLNSPANTAALQQAVNAAKAQQKTSLVSGNMGLLLLGGIALAGIFLFQKGKEAPAKA